MARTYLILICIIMQCLVGLQLSRAGQGDVRHVVSHDKVKVVTDPSTGTNVFKRWAAFPTDQSDYRKVVLYVTYQCPDSQHCGEWDYIDNIYIRRIGGQAAVSKDIEICRMISPYGWRFGSDWKFTWHVDVTDFAFLLHDSIEVEFQHGGYESNTDRGWLITLDFEITYGKPAVTVLGMDTLWQGTVPYGDSTKPADSVLSARQFENSHKASIARFRILQTGHGMDDSENCAEFCSKWRRLLVDDSVIAERQIWKKCGDNPLSPQAGTWLYDRANWCPGSIVQPDVYDYPIAPGSSHRAQIRLEPYINRKHPTANYALSAYLFYCAPPRAGYDASLEEILAPSVDDEYSRMNPVCANPRILVKNSGRETLTSLTIKYGMVDEREQAYEWTGLLASQKNTEIDLPGPIVGREGVRQFRVKLESPNGHRDEYQWDNTGVSDFRLPPTCGTEFILALRTNNQASHNSYTIRDVSGAVAKERALGSLTDTTMYYDTVSLSPGCYRMVVRDTAGDGLDFWANPDGGYGFVRLLDLNGRLIKAFTSDFGSEITYWFSVAVDAKLVLATDQLPIVNPFPIRNRGTFAVELFLNDPANANVAVTTEDSSRVVFQKECPNTKAMFLPVDISAEPDGFYFVKVTVDGKTVSRKIKVKHKD